MWYKIPYYKQTIILVEIKKENLALLLESTEESLDKIERIMPDVYNKILDLVIIEEDKIQDLSCKVFWWKIRAIIWTNAMRQVYKQEMKKLEKQEYFNAIILSIENYEISIPRFTEKFTIKELLISWKNVWFIEFDLLKWEHNKNNKNNQHIKTILSIIQSLKQSKFTWNDLYEEFLKKIEIFINS